MLERACRLAGRLSEAKSAKTSAGPIGTPVAPGLAVSSSARRRDPHVTGTATDDRRRHERVVGPFDGRRLGMIDTDVQIYDLSLGGCFVTSSQEQEEGRTLTLEIDLPNEGRITVDAKTIYCRSGFGFAAEFTNLTEEARQRIERALASWRSPRAW